MPLQVGPFGERGLALAALEVAVVVFFQVISQSDLRGKIPFAKVAGQ